MPEETRALMLHSRRDPLRTLTQALERQGVKTVQACNCAEASRLLQGFEPPELLFTDTKLPDGNWADAIRLAQKAAAPVNVIVVSRLVDVRLYVEALEAGAFDFIAPPFEDSELAHVVRCAAGNAEARRQAKLGTKKGQAETFAPTQKPVFLSSKA